MQGVGRGGRVVVFGRVLDTSSAEGHKVFVRRHLNSTAYILFKDKISNLH